VLRRERERGLRLSGCLQTVVVCPLVSAPVETPGPFCIGVAFREQRALLPRLS
jgi:hypothetical protein